MATELLSGSIPNLINGVSQQPPSLRLPTQAQAQLNGLSSVVDGLSKRPNTEFIKKLGNNGSMNNAFIHTMQRDANEFYILVIHSTIPRVFDANGVERTVSYTSAAAYYLSNIANYADDISATTVNDYTFIVNKNKEVEEDTTVSSTRNPEALVYVKKGDYATDYKIKVTKGGTTYNASYTTMNSTQSSDALVQSAENTVQTDNICSQLRGDYIGSSAIPNVTITTYGDSILHFESTDGSEFDIETSDSNGNTQLLSFKDTVSDFKTLPPVGPTGFKIAVIGDNTKGQDDYYVSLQKPDTNSKQVWKETLADNIKTNIKGSRMPHQLISNADGTFTFQQATWDARDVGDDNTNPFPSFVGQKINDVFFHQNRLGVLSGENVIMSENGSFYNFFTKTVLTTLDSAPIDVAVSNNQVSVLKHAVPFDNTLLLFSDLNQFKLEGDVVLSNETVSIAVTTQFEADLTAKPVGSGKHVYFATSRNAYAGIREYYVDSDVETNDANSITSHVPSYIDGSVTGLAASSNEDMLLVRSSTSGDKVFVYSYYWQGNEKLQSAWSTWQLSGSVRNFHFTKSDIWFIIEDSTGIYLEKLPLNIQPSSTNSVTASNINFIPLIDRKKAVESGDFNNGTFTPEYSNSNMLVVGNDGSIQTVQQFDSQNVVFPTNKAYWYGIPYLFQYEFSEITMKVNEQPLSTGRLQLRNMTLLYNDTGKFTIEVSNKARDVMTTEFNANTVDSSSSSLNSVTLATGTFKFGILAQSENTSIKLSSNSHIPCTFQSAEWEGMFTNRNRRV